MKMVMKGNLQAEASNLKEIIRLILSFFSF